MQASKKLVIAESMVAQFPTPANQEAAKEARKQYERILEAERVKRDSKVR